MFRLFDSLIIWYLFKHLIHGCPPCFAITLHFCGWSRYQLFESLSTPTVLCLLYNFTLASKHKLSFIRLGRSRVMSIQLWRYLDAKQKKNVGANYHSYSKFWSITQWMQECEYVRGVWKRCMACACRMNMSCMWMHVVAQKGCFSTLEYTDLPQMYIIWTAIFKKFKFWFFLHISCISIISRAMEIHISGTSRCMEIAEYPQFSEILVSYRFHV